MRPALLACLLLAGAAAPAQAQPAKGPPGADGPLFVSPAGEPFRGGDGLAAWFSGADADHDGALTPAEFRADALRFFKTLDTDGDGAIDGFEVQRYEAQVAPEITAIVLDGARPARGRREMQLGRQGAARFGLLNTPHPVRAGDLDLDGRVTEAEWVRATARRFDLLDKAKAGKLTMETLRPPAPMRGRR
jgi:hypothetical protein